MQIYEFIANFLIFSISLAMTAVSLPLLYLFFDSLLEKEFEMSDDHRLLIVVTLVVIIIIITT